MASLDAKLRRECGENPVLEDEDGVVNIMLVLLLLFAPAAAAAPVAGPQLPDRKVVETAVWSVEAEGKELWKSDDEDVEETVDAEGGGLWL
jgi:hypothetical protein